MTDQPQYQPQQPAQQPGPPQPGQPVHPAGPPQPGYPAPPLGAQPYQYPQPGYPQPGQPQPVYGAPYAAAYSPGVRPLGASDPRDLTLPLYGASFGQAITRYFKKYASFSGRASRSEYWWVQLFLFLVWLVPTALLLITVISGTAWVAQQNSYSADLFDAPGTVLVFSLFWLVTFVIGLGTIIPSLAIAWRRLHDANFAGPFWFLTFTYVGGLVVLVFTILPSNPMGQRFDRR